MKAAWINRASGQQAKSPGLQGSAGASAKALETPFPERSVPVPWKCGTGLTYLSTEARMEGSEGILLFKEEFGSRSQVSSCPRSLPVVVAAYFKMLMIEY